MRTSDFDYHLPEGLIAQTPVEPRDASRLMVLERQGRAISHSRFSSLAGYLRDGDVLVFNDTRVIPARLEARKKTGAKLEVLLLQRLGPGTWETLIRPAKRAPAGTHLEIAANPDAVRGPGAGTTAEVLEARDDGGRVLRFADEAALPGLGQIPLPPYVHVPLDDPERYQTVYARADGSVAAPTAGLHFTPELMAGLRLKGVRCVFVTLHVGLDTFRPVRTEDPLDHPIHREYGIVGPDVAAELSQAKADGRRVICVGTTSVRLVEAAARFGGPARAGGPPLVSPFSGWVDLFVLPGYEFKAVDAMLTNFHLPRTTLLMLVSAFAGRDFVMEAYRAAVAENYRFYSFGDAMLIL